MKLLTRKILAALPKFNATEDIPWAEKLVICKFFISFSDLAWYVFEGEWSEELGSYEFFGYMQGLENSFEYFSLLELENIFSLTGLGVMRDIRVFKQPFKQLVDPKEYARNS